jgi:protoheme IX farnesyltransferase
MERGPDSRMKRTKKRPLPSGKLKPVHAFWFAVALSVLGYLELWLGANLLTANLGFFTLASYLFVYTPLKQRTPHSTTIGAIPGAMPPVIGFAAANGSLTVEALVLFGILFFWQFPHFYSIAWLYREDYSRGGIKMLPVVDETGERTVRHILLTALILIPVSMAPTWLGMAGSLYLGGALLLSCTYFYYGLRIRRERTMIAARGVLMASIVYLPLLYGLLLADRPGL